MDDGIKIDAHLQAFERLPGRIRSAFAATRKAMHVWAIDAHGEFVETHLSGNPIRRWTGQLERSFQPVWSESEASLKAGVAFAKTMTGPKGQFSNYANALEDDETTITPKNGRMLAFPMPGGPALTAGGIPRVAGPRDYPGKLFVHKTAKGGLCLAEKDGDSLRAVYILAHSVTIHGRMGFRPWAKAKREQGVQEMRDTFARELAA